MRSVGADRLVLVGHSLGAAAALAADPAGVQGLLLLDPAGLTRLRVRPGTLAATLPWLLRPTPARSARLLAHMHAEGRAPSPQHFEWMTLVARNVRTSLAPSPLPGAVLDRSARHGAGRSLRGPGLLPPGVCSGGGGPDEAGRRPRGRGRVRTPDPRGPAGAPHRGSRRPGQTAPPPAPERAQDRRAEEGLAAGHSTGSRKYRDGHGGARSWGGPPLGRGRRPRRRPRRAAAGASARCPPPTPRCPPPTCGPPSSPARTSGSPATPSRPAGSPLPVTDQLTSVADLFSDRTRCGSGGAVPTDHRVDVVTAAGETGTYRDECGTWTWEYERATRHPRASRRPLALPAPPDLLPSLARPPAAVRGHRRRADPDRRPPGAGPDALGLRLTPADGGVVGGPGRRLGRRRSGLPLQVRGVEKGADRPALDTRFLDLELAGPSPTSPRSPRRPASRFREAREAEIVLEAGRRIGPVPLPAELAGLPRRQLERRAAGHRPLRPRRDPARGRAGARGASPAAAERPARRPRTPSSTSRAPGSPPGRSG